MADDDVDDEYDYEFAARHEDDSFFRDALRADVDRCEQLFAAAPKDAFVRRTLVRTIFAQIEGLAASAIEWARYYADDTSALKDNYALAERLVLSGRVAALDDKGVAQIAPDRNRARTTARLRFVLSLVGRGAEQLPDVDCSGPGWAALLDGLRVRDRLMHPKVAADVDVTDIDLQRARDGRAWFVATYEARDSALQATIAKRIFQKIAAL